MLILLLLQWINFEISIDGWLYRVQTMNSFSFVKTSKGFDMLMYCLSSVQNKFDRWIENQQLWYDLEVKQSERSSEEPSATWEKFFGEIKSHKCDGYNL